VNLDAIVIGLGNPGSRYAWTRHNAGFLALDWLVDDLGQAWEQSGSVSKATRAYVCKTNWNSKNVLLLKPQTFMNLSGESLRGLFSFGSHLRSLPLIVLHDEIDLPFGKLRCKVGGSDAGHNGLKSIREHLGHGDFYRVRLGVGRPTDGTTPVADHVLQPFVEAEEPALKAMIEKSLKVCELLLDNKLSEAQELAAKSQA
jgi:PTH1 family peptidyl-tRNA hydrolase